MTPPRDPRPMTPPDPLEITEEEYRAAEERFQRAERHFNSAHSLQELLERIDEYRAAKTDWQDAQRRAASDHQTLMRDDPAYRREVREREWS